MNVVRRHTSFEELTPYSAAGVCRKSLCTECSAMTRTRPADRTIESLLFFCWRRGLCPNNVDLSDTMRKCWIGAAFTLLLLLYRTSVRPRVGKMYAVCIFHHLMLCNDLSVFGFCRSFLPFSKLTELITK